MQLVCALPNPPFPNRTPYPLTHPVANLSIFQNQYGI